MRNRPASFAPSGGVVLAMATMLAISATSARGDLILFNASASAPEGFYVRENVAAHRGAFVTVRARDVAPSYAHQRHFDGLRDRFIKRIAAGEGDWVCARGARVIVGARVLARFDRDGRGRSLPQWQGCRRLARREWFLLGDVDQSFDSRYWGPVRNCEIEGVWRPLLPSGRGFVSSRQGARTMIEGNQAR